MHNPVINPDFVLQQRLAKELGVTLRTLQRWRERKRSPPFTTIGRSVYYRRQAVNEWLREREVTLHHSRYDLKPIAEANPHRNARQRNARRTANK